MCVARAVALLAVVAVAGAGGGGGGHDAHLVAVPAETPTPAASPAPAPSPAPGDADMEEPFDPGSMEVPAWRELWYGSLEALHREPTINNTQEDVLAQLGSLAFLHCPVRNLGERGVRILDGTRYPVTCC